MSNDVLNVQRGIVGSGAGNDVYVLSASLVEVNAQITISDVEGANTIQLIGGLEIVSSIVANNTLQLTLSNGAVVTVLGASTMSYELGGNPLFGEPGVEKTYSDFAQDVLGVEVPAAGQTAVEGSGAVVNNDGSIGDGGDTDTSAPVVVSGQGISYVENRVVGETLLTVEATDDTEVTGFSIVSGNEAGYFAIDNEGNISLTAAGAAIGSAANDFETGSNNFTLGVAAVDAAGNTSAAVGVDLALTDVDDAAPTLLGAESTANTVTLTFSEVLQDLALPVGAFIVKDQAGASLSISSVLVANDQVTLTLSAPSATIASVSYTPPAAGNLLQDAAGNPVTAILDIVTTDVEAPTVTGAAFSYAENSTVGTVLGTVVGSDNVAVTGYEIVSGNDNGFFAISANGNISLTAAGVAAGAASNDFETLPNGFELGIQATDLAGNQSELATVTLSLTDVDDRAPVLTEAAVNGTTLQLTFDETLVSANLPPNAFSVSAGGTSYAVSAAQASGNTLTLTLVSGTEGPVTVSYNPVTAGASALQDALGNKVAAISSATVEDAQAPIVLASNVHYLEGQVAGAILGTLTASDNLDVVDYEISSGNASGFFDIDSDGNIILTALGAASEANDYETTPNSFALGVKAIDAAGNESVAAQVVLYEDNVDDTAPTALSAAANSSSITLSFDEALQVGALNTAAFSVSQGATSLSIASIQVSGSQVIINVGAAAQPLTGNLTVNYNPAVGGSLLKDAANNLVSGFTQSTSAVDTTAPVLSAFTPADDSTNVAVGDSLTLTFSETVVASTGNITLVNAADPTDTRTIAASDTTQVSISGNQVIVNPTSDLQAGKNYYVNIAGTAFKDVANNAYVGVSNNTSFNFATAAAGTPALTSSVVAVDEGSSVTFTLSNAAANTTYSYNLSGVTVGDLSGAASLLGTFTTNPSGAGTFTVTLANDKTTEGPENLTATIIGELGGNTVTKTVTVNDTSTTNHAPVITTAVSELDVVEGATVASGQLTATDADGDALTFSLPTSVAGLTLNANGSYTFNPANAAYTSVEPGDTRTLEVDYNVTDGTATSTETLVINVAGKPITYTLTAVSQAGDPNTANNGVTEGYHRTFTVTASEAVRQDTVVEFTLLSGATTPGISPTDVVKTTYTTEIAQGSTTTTFTIEPYLDGVTEFPESYTLVADVDATLGGAATTLTASGRVIDSTALPSYTISANKATVSEVDDLGQVNSVTFTLDAPGVAAGTQVAYTVTGISANDLSAGNLSGFFTVGANGKGNVTLSFAADHLEEGDETITLSLDSDTAIKAVVTLEDNSVPVGVDAQLTQNTDVDGVFDGTSANDIFTANPFGTDSEPSSTLHAADVIIGAGGNSDRFILRATEDYNTSLVGSVSGVELIDITGSDYIDSVGSQTEAQLDAVTGERVDFLAAHDAVLSAYEAYNAAYDAYDDANIEAGLLAAAIDAVVTTGSNSGDYATLQEAINRLQVDESLKDTVLTAITTAYSGGAGDLAAMQTAALDSSTGAIDAFLDELFADLGILDNATDAALLTLGTAATDFQTAIATAWADHSVIDASFFVGSTEVSLDGQFTDIENIDDQLITLNGGTAHTELEYLTGVTSGAVVLDDTSAFLSIAGSQVGFESLTVSGTVNAGEALEPELSLWQFENDFIPAYLLTDVLAQYLGEEAVTELGTLWVEGAGEPSLVDLTSITLDLDNAAIFGANGLIGLTNLVSTGNADLIVLPFGYDFADVDAINITTAGGNDLILVETDMTPDDAAATATATVSTGAGDDTVMLFGERLLIDGDDIDGGEGTDTFYATVELEDGDINYLSAGTYVRLQALQNFEILHFANDEDDFIVDAAELTAFDELHFDDSDVVVENAVEEQLLVLTKFATSNADLDATAVGYDDEAASGDYNALADNLNVLVMSADDGEGGGTWLDIFAKAAAITLDAAAVGQDVWVEMGVNESDLDIASIALNSSDAGYAYIDIYAHGSDPIDDDYEGMGEGFTTLSISGEGWAYVENSYVDSEGDYYGGTLTTVNASGMTGGEFAYIADFDLKETITLGDARNFIEINSVAGSPSLIKMDTITGLNLVLDEATDSFAEDSDVFSFANFDFKDKDVVINAAAVEFDGEGEDAAGFVVSTTYSSEEGAPDVEATQALFEVFSGSLASAGSLAAALNTVASSATQDNVVFAYQGNTYIFAESEAGTSESTFENTDLVVKLVGTYDLTDLAALATVASTQLDVVV